MRIAFVSLALFAILAAGCGEDLETTREALFEQGPFGVGYVETELTYDEVASADERTLPLQIWYPSDGGSALGAYRLGGVVEVATTIALDAPAPATGPVPVVVYSHGSGGQGLIGYPFGERLASYGYVVVSLDHVGNTALEALLGSPGDAGSRIALNRPNDITAILDWIEAGGDGLDVAAQSDVSAVMVVGHSFGGYTAFAAAGADVDQVQASGEACEGDDPDPLCDAGVAAAYQAGFGDPRVAAIVPQAPAVGFFDAAAIEGVDVPMMLQTGRLDMTTTAESTRRAWDFSDGADDIWVEMPTGGHISFITVCYDLNDALINAFYDNADGEGCGPDSIDARLAIDTLTAYMLAFAERHIGGDASLDAVLRGPAFRQGFEIFTR